MFHRCGTGRVPSRRNTTARPAFPRTITGARSLTAWKFVKRRTAADSVGWRFTDGLLYKRTGGASVDGEAHFQRLLAELGYPVPELVKTGQTDGVHYLVEHSVGNASLHELALSETGHVSQDVIERAVEISTRLLTAQARNPLPGGPAQLREWISRRILAGQVLLLPGSDAPERPGKAACQARQMAISADPSHDGIGAV